MKWVDKMIDYTVAGGKMNRGLALMAVQQTLAQSQGRTLSNKVPHRNKQQKIISLNITIDMVLICVC